MSVANICKNNRGGAKIDESVDLKSYRVWNLNLILGHGRVGM